MVKRPKPAGKPAKDEGRVPLESVLHTDELKRRPERPPDYKTESRAQTELVQALADAPGGILERLAETILAVCNADSAGISLLTKDEKKFHWPAIAGVWKPHVPSHRSEPSAIPPIGTHLVERSVF